MYICMYEYINLYTHNIIWSVGHAHVFMNEKDEHNLQTLFREKITLDYYFTFFKTVF